MCSQVPDSLGIKPFCIRCSMYRLADKNAKMETLNHDFQKSVSQSNRPEVSRVRLVTSFVNKHCASFLPFIGDLPGLPDSMKDFSQV